jgi:hypothetical protein
MVEAQAKAQATQQQTAAKIEGDKQSAMFDMMIERMREENQRRRDEDDFRHKQALDQMKFAHEAQMQKIQAAFDMQIEAFKAREEMKINAQQATLQAKQGVNNV